jgi:hypothetical protein
MRAGHVALCGQHDLIGQRERGVLPELRPEVARRSEVGLVLDGDQFPEPVAGIPRDLPDAAADRALEEPDFDRLLGDSAGALGSGVDGLHGVARSPDAHVALDGRVGNRLRRQVRPGVHLRAGFDAEHVEDPICGFADAAADLAGHERLLVGFEVRAQRQLEGILSHALDSGPGKEKDSLGVRIADGKSVVVDDDFDRRFFARLSVLARALVPEERAGDRQHDPRPPAGEVERVPDAEGLLDQHPLVGVPVRRQHSPDARSLEVVRKA